jgi:uroporphyrinogen III methyltransferase/synthase
MEALLDAGLAPATLLASVRLATVGPQTAHALTAYGMTADVVAEQHHAEGLFKALSQTTASLQGKRILLFQADRARDALADLLQQAGAYIQVTTAYHTVHSYLTETQKADLVSRIMAGQIQMFTFCSASAVASFAEQFDGLLQACPAAVWRQVRLASIGPLTSQTLGAHWGRIDVEAEDHTVNGLVAAICWTTKPLRVI